MSKKDYCFNLSWGPEYSSPFVESWVDTWWDPNKFHYFVCSVERGEKTGHIHLQCYIECKEAYGAKKMHEILGAKFNIQRRRGSRDQAKEYCMKSDTHLAGPFERGVWRASSGQGHRSDLDSLARMVDSGATDRELFEEMPGHVLRFGKQIDHLRHRMSMESAYKYRPMEVICYYGEAGAGKSRAVWEECGYDPRLIYRLPLQHGETLWLGQYQGQKALLIDDMDGSTMKYRVFLQLVDHYPLEVQTKGGFVWALWEKIYITSNVHPRSWWYVGWPKALSRRFSKIVHFPDQSEKLAEVAGNGEAATDSECEEAELWPDDL